MSNEYGFEFIKTVEQLDRLHTFAATFDHTIPSAAHPLVVFKNGEDWKGFAQIITKPIVFPAWNPHVCTARDVQEGFTRVSGWLDLQYGGGFITAPTNKETKFTEKVMNKLGSKRMFLELYER